MKSINLNQLMYPSQELVNETLINLEIESRIEYLKNLMKIYKKKNRELYKRIQREYLALIK
jgi:hypothetical protein